MIYFDYSATTPVNQEVLESFNKACTNFIGNANSLHSLGIKAHKLIEESTKQIANILNIKPSEIIYTSSSSEANNLAIKGVCFKYKNRGKHIITTKYEHSSSSECLKYLESIGYEISYVKTHDNGVIDIEDLKKIIRDDTILVSISAVNSEIGIIEPVEEIACVLKSYHKCFFHVDLTQSIGKINISLENIDLASFSAHKIYGLKGIGCLIKKDDVLIEPLFHGGKSTTIYRSGTPAHPLIVSISKALRLAVFDIDNKYEKVKALNKYLQDKLKFDDVYINSNSSSIPHILNISVKGIKSETLMHALEEYDIYVSTKTACSKSDSYSESVYELTKDIELAKSSIRISISHLTTKEEIDKLVAALKLCLDKMKK